MFKYWFSILPPVYLHLELRERERKRERERERESIGRITCTGIKGESVLLHMYWYSETKSF